MRRRSRRLFAVLLLLLALAVALYLDHRSLPPPDPGPSPLTGKLVVWFLDVGQGDSQLLTLPGGENILIDSGDRGAPTVEMLERYGVRSLDLIVATHPHSDHIGEMRAVIARFKVNEFWDSGFAHPSKTYTSLLREIKERGIRFSTPKRGDTRKLGDITLEVLNPPRETPVNDANGASLVIRVTFGSKRFLFTGDIEADSWQRMIADEGELLRADLLKAAHHGSSDGTSAGVLNAVRPSILTISCAGGNDFHHPHPRVVDLLEQRNEIKLYRTDLQGTLTAVCDGTTIEMQTEKRIASDRLYLTGDEVAGKVAGYAAGEKAAGGRAAGSR